MKHLRMLAAWAALLPALSPAQGPGPMAASTAASSVDGRAWAPSDAEATQVNLLTQRYFSLKDAGNFPAAYAMTSREMQQGASLERWSIREAEFSARAGAVKNRSIRKITWYKDPPSAHARGVFAAVDHAATFENIDIHCGYLMWHQQPDGSFKLFGQTENSIDKKTQAGMSAQQLAAARKAFRC